MHRPGMCFCGNGAESERMTTVIDDPGFDVGATQIDAQKQSGLLWFVHGSLWVDGVQPICRFLMVPVATEAVQAVFCGSCLVSMRSQVRNFSGLPARPSGLNSTGHFSRFFPAVVMIRSEQMDCRDCRSWLIDNFLLVKVLKNYGFKCPTEQAAAEKPDSGGFGDVWIRA
jgi:hypothetical protein